MINRIKRRVIALSAMILIGIALSLSFLFIHVPRAEVSVTEPTLYTVKSGMGFNQFCRDLAEKDIVSTCGPLKWYSTFQKRLRNIKKGTYNITPSMTQAELLNIVSLGHEHQFSITLVEGENIYQLLDKLKNVPNLVHDIAYQAPEDIQRSLGISEPHLEGLFFPDTYYYLNGTYESDILKRAYAKLRQTLEDAWKIRDVGLPYDSPYQALIMASIIEKETAIPGERPLIASVFVNRLNKGMRLQTDPTVIYGLGADFNGNLTRQHLRTKTAYNTYRINGLPPTPIAMVGEDAINAALHPIETDYFYFVAKGDKSHHFSETLDEHNRAVREYQLKRQ